MTECEGANVQPQLPHNLLEWLESLPPVSVTIEEIMKGTGLSRASVYRAIRGLQRKGLLKMYPAQGRHDV